MRGAYEEGKRLVETTCLAYLVGVALDAHYASVSFVDRVLVMLCAAVLYRAWRG